MKIRTNIHAQIDARIHARVHAQLLTSALRAHISGCHRSTSLRRRRGFILLLRGSICQSAGAGFPQLCSG